MASRIKGITVEIGGDTTGLEKALNVLIFRFYNGLKVTRKWKDRSRSESWTPEMKAAARQKVLETAGTFLP